MLVLLALLLGQQTDAEMAAMRARVAAQPPAIREFVERRAMCNHFMGEEPYDRARRREIEAALREGRCATTDAEHAFLRRHFAARPETVALLDETRDSLGW